ncbi:MAG: hypothetical protein JKX86_08150 [Verrucomicrobiales bacterium]|nr:hypothetical protein [Verrucomicrobiales bacterium]
MANYEAIYRYPINGSPTQIEVSPGLTSEKGPIPGAVVGFVEEGEVLFCTALDAEDIQTLILMLMDCLVDGAESKGGGK